MGCREGILFSTKLKILRDHMGDNLETLKEVNISIISINLAKRMTEWQDLSRLGYTELRTQ